MTALIEVSIGYRWSELAFRQALASREHAGLSHGAQGATSTPSGQGALRARTLTSSNMGGPAGVFFLSARYVAPRSLNPASPAQVRSKRGSPMGGWAATRPLPANYLLVILAQPALVPAHPAWQVRRA